MKNTTSVTGIAAAKNEDGRLALFYIGPDQRIYHQWQTYVGSDSWSLAQPLATGKAKQIVLAANEDGRLELFYSGAHDNIYHNWQKSPNGDWNGEQEMTGKAKQIAVVKRQDGCLELFYIGTDDNIYHNWQKSAGGNWNGETKFGGKARQIAVGVHGDGRLEVFYIGTDKDYTIYNNWQESANGVWNGEAKFGGTAKQIAAAVHLDTGAVDVSYTGTDGKLYHKWQTEANGAWNGPVELGGESQSLEVLVANNAGRLDLFYIGSDNTIYNQHWLNSSAVWSAATQIEEDIADEAIQVKDYATAEGLLKKFAPLVYLASNRANEFDSRPCSVEWLLQYAGLVKPEALNKQPKASDYAVQPGQLTPQNLIAQNDNGIPSGTSNYRDYPQTNYSLFFPLLNEDKQFSPVHLEDDPFAKGQPLVDGKCVANCYGRVRKSRSGDGGYELLYLFLYSLNGATGPLPDKEYAGVHVSDWEHITIRTDSSGNRVQEVYFSRHNDGQGKWISYDSADMEKTADGRVVVYSARYSHGSFPRAASYQNPKFKYGAPDNCDQGVRWETWNHMIHVGSLANPTPGNEWLQYNGFWGSKYLANKGKKKVVPPIPGMAIWTYFISAIASQILSEKLTEISQGPRTSSFTNWWQNESTESTRYDYATVDIPKILG